MILTTSSSRVTLNFLVVVSAQSSRNDHITERHKEHQKEFDGRKQKVRKQHRRITNKPGCILVTDLEGSQERNEAILDFNEKSVDQQHNHNRRSERS